MGALLYQSVKVEFDDRLLTHLQLVIVNKFRRNEGFVMSWVRAPALGSGRGAIWMTPAVPIFFAFHGSRVPSINDAWVHRLKASADGPRGLIVTNEDGSLAHEGAPSSIRGLSVVDSL